MKTDHLNSYSTPEQICDFLGKIPMGDVKTALTLFVRKYPYEKQNVLNAIDEGDRRKNTRQRREEDRNA